MNDTAAQRPGAMFWLADDEAAALRRLVAEFQRDGGRMDGDDDAAADAYATALESAADALNEPKILVTMTVSRDRAHCINIVQED